MHFPMDYLCTFLYHQKAHFQVSKSKSVKIRPTTTFPDTSVCIQIKLNVSFFLGRLNKGLLEAPASLYFKLSASEWVSESMSDICFRISSKSSNFRWSRYQDNHDNYDNQDNQVRLALLWADFRVIFIARQVLFSCTALVTFPFQKGHWGQSPFTFLSTRTLHCCISQIHQSSTNAKWEKSWNCEKRRTWRI